MSSNEAIPDPPDIVQFTRTTITNNSINLAILTVTLYDWILTFPDEIQIIWRRPVTGAKVLFLMNRYCSITFYAFVLISGLPWDSSSSCSRIVIMINILLVLHTLIVSAFQIIWLYAISGRKRRFAFLIGTFNILPNLFEIYVLAISEYRHTPQILDEPECQDFLPPAAVNTYTKLNITQRICSIVAVLITGVVTIYYTYGTVKVSRKANLRTAFSSTLLYAGAFYSTVMCAMNVTGFILLLRNNNDLGNIPSLIDYIMISHILFVLQRMSSVTTHCDSDEPSRPSFVRSSHSQVTSVRFADILTGDMGETLYDGSSQDYDEDDGEAKIKSVTIGSEGEHTHASP